MGAILGARGRGGRHRTLRLARAATAKFSVGRPVTQIQAVETQAKATQEEQRQEIIR